MILWDKQNAIVKIETVYSEEFEEFLYSCNASPSEINEASKLNNINFELTNADGTKIYSNNYTNNFNTIHVIFFIYDEPYIVSIAFEGLGGTTIDKLSFNSGGGGVFIEETVTATAASIVIPDVNAIPTLICGQCLGTGLVAVPRLISFMNNSGVIGTTQSGAHVDELTTDVYISLDETTLTITSGGVIAPGNWNIIMYIEDTNNVT